MKQINLRAVVHLPLHEFELCDLPLRLAVGPGRRDSGAHSGFVLRDAVGEGGNKAIPRPINPRDQTSVHFASGHLLEVGDDLARLDESGNAGFNRGDCDSVGLRFGLSYTTFNLRDLAVAVDGDAVTASASVRNTGERMGAAIPQFYVSGSAPAAIPLRLAGWERTVLQPGEERRVSVSIDPRLLASFDEAGRRWRIMAGTLRRAAPRPDGERAARPIGPSAMIRFSHL